MPAFTFIVPALDVRDFIDELLASLAAQTVDDFEAIVVDDGSTDGTRELVRATCDRDPRFRLIDGDGLGPGAARNRALDQARGEVLAFVDADDVVHPRYVELVGAMRATLDPDDVAVLAFARGTTPHWPDAVDGTVRPHRALDVAVQGKAIWRLSMTRRFVERHGIRFLATRNYEDAVVTTAVLIHARRFVRLTAPLYFYRQRPGSLITRRGAARVDDALQAIEAVTRLRLALSADAPKALIDLARIRMIVGQYRLLPRAEQRAFLATALAKAQLARPRALGQALAVCALSGGSWWQPTLRFVADTATGSPRTPARV